MKENGREAVTVRPIVLAPVHVAPLHFAINIPPVPQGGSAPPLVIAPIAMSVAVPTIHFSPVDVAPIIVNNRK